MNERRFNLFLPEAPEEFTQAILESRARIHRYEVRRGRRRRRLMLAAAVTAAMCAVGGGLFKMRLPGVDSVALEARSAPAAATELPDAVFAHQEDAYFHVTLDCAQCRKDAVLLPYDTARNFQKLACPICMDEVE